MVSEKFRHQLRQEVEQWQTEGLIDSLLYDRLAQRYQFNTLESAARNHFILILLGLGSILLGLAVITFVAANWQIWTKEVKVVLLLSLFMGINAAGFYLWRRPTERWQSRAGQSLLLLGSLVLGANLALMSQLFHLSGPAYELYLVWGIGVLAMAYSLRLTLLAVFAVILVALGYCSGFPNLYYSVDLSQLQPLLHHMPLFASIAFIPLAYWCRSRWLFGMSAILVVASLEANLLFVTFSLFDLSSGMAEIVAALSCTLPPALLWAYRDSIWKRSPEATPRFDPIAKGIALTFLCLLFYILSFEWLWSSLPSPGFGEIPAEALPILLDALILGGFALYSWWKLGYQRSSIWRIDLMTTVVGAMILIAGSVVWLHWRIEPLGAIAIFVFNALLFLLEVGLIREALGTAKRGGFWLGVLLMVLHLMSRMLEYDTGLLFKAIVLFFCGVCVIAAGLWFERYVRVLART
ncbi:DUF2157 domain-containing protein [Lusitaniella coriacea]|uniref:DUF2157 domain-containing protein n=1 Tax=Lusitaniella coriacea TaxID=1983105 RepID=UPI003CED82A9